MDPTTAARRSRSLLLTGAGVSFVGDEVAGVALAIGVHGAGGSGFAVAAVILATLLPRVVLAPLTGALLDSVETTRLIRRVSLLAGLLTVGLAFTDALPARLALLAAVSTGSALISGGTLALVPTIAARDGAQRLMSTVSTVNRGSAVAGPILGASLVGGVGVRGALLLDAASFLVLAAAFSAMPVRRQPADRSAPAELRRGLTTLFSDTSLAVPTAVLLVAFVFVGVSYVATVFLAEDALHSGADGVGLLTASYGAGMTLGCLACRRVPAARLGRWATTAPAVVGLGLLVAAVAPALALASAGFALAGTAAGCALTALRSIVLLRTPQDLLGRVLAAEGALGTASELLALALGGVLVTAAGPRVALLVAGFGALAPVLVAPLASRRPRRRQAGRRPAPPVAHRLVARP